MKTTITDVARSAGVSMKTVSRVLNNEPNVTDRTRERVKAAVETLRYRPNLSARGLASSRSYLIALLYDNPSADYIAEIQKGATHVCREKGYHLVVEPINVENADLSLEMEYLLQRLPVDGVILTPPLTDNESLLTVLNAEKTPYVQIAPLSVRSGHPSVGMDDARAAQEMTRYLISIGHKKIGFIQGHINHSASKLRQFGYERAMREGGLAINPDWLVRGDFSFQSGKRCAKALLQSSQDRPTAIFASNDDMAAAVISVAGEMGLSVPRDLSVCGFDDTALATVLWPPLTTIRQPIEEMGSRAAQILIKGATNSDEVLPPLLLEHNIIVRGSTGSPQG